MAVLKPFNGAVPNVIRHAYDVLFCATAELSFIKGKFLRVNLPFSIVHNSNSYQMQDYFKCSTPKDIDNK